jgi:CelD/BcsL family acetyltransferase involved in cellulose biosynthesis
LLWNRRGRLGHFVDWPGISAFYHEIARCLFEQGSVALVQVRANGELIASEFGSCFGRRLHWLIGGRRPDASSRIGFCSLLRIALCNSVTQIDALGGYYHYKARLGAAVLQLRSVTAIHRGFMSGLRACSAHQITRLLHLLYYRIWFGRFAQRFPRWQRPLWRSWIRISFLRYLTC